MNEKHPIADLMDLIVEAASVYRFHFSIAGGF
jgi:hypothetical protein